VTARGVDFLRAPSPPAAGWVLLAVGIVALATALWFEQRWASERVAAESAHERALAAQRALSAPPPRREPSIAQRRWQQAQVELQRPWLPALRAIEGATVNPVFLLGMTIEPSQGLVKLDAEAASFDHALAYVQVLDIGGALEPAALISHEHVVDATGRNTVRFSAVTRWVVVGNRPGVP
jgi:hypothetical protein